MLRYSETCRCKSAVGLDEKKHQLSETKNIGEDMDVEASQVAES